MPVIWLTYWSFRAMIGAGVLLMGLTAWGLWLLRKGRLGESVWYRRAALAGIALPLISNSTGWIFTEVGRQPWIVYGLMTTAKGVSAVTTADVALTTVVFILLYTVLGIIAGLLMARAARRDLVVEESTPPRPLVPTLVY